MPPKDTNDVVPILQQIHGELRQLNAVSQQQREQVPQIEMPQAGQLPFQFDGGYLQRPYYDATQLNSYLSDQLSSYSQRPEFGGMDFQEAYSGVGSGVRSDATAILEKIHNSIQDVVSAIESTKRSAMGAGAFAAAAPGSIVSGIHLAGDTLSDIPGSVLAGGGMLGHDVRRIAGDDTRGMVREFKRLLAQNTAGQRGRRYVGPLETLGMEASILGAMNTGATVAQNLASLFGGAAIGAGTGGVGAIAGGIALDMGLGAAKRMVMRPINEGYMEGVMAYRQSADAIRAATGRRSVAGMEAMSLAIMMSPSREMAATQDVFLRGIYGTTTEEFRGSVQRMADEGRLDQTGTKSFRGVASRIRSRVLKTIKDVDEASRLLNVTRDEAWRLVEQGERRGVSARAMIQAVTTASIATGQSQQAVLDQIQRNTQVLGAMGVAPGQLGISLPGAAGTFAAGAIGGLTQREIQRVGGRAGVSEAATNFALAQGAQTKDMITLALGAGVSPDKIGDWRTLQLQALQGIGSIRDYYTTIARGKERFRDLTGKQYLNMQIGYFGSMADTFIPGINEMGEQEGIEAMTGMLELNLGMDDDQAKAVAVGIFRDRRMKKEGREAEIEARTSAELAVGESIARGEKIAEAGLGGLSDVKKIAIRQITRPGMLGILDMSRDTWKLQAEVITMATSKADEALTKALTDLELIKEGQYGAAREYEKKEYAEQRKRTAEARTVMARGNLFGDKSKYWEVKEGNEDYKFAIQKIRTERLHNDIKNKVDENIGSDEKITFLKEKLFGKGKDEGLSDSQVSAIAMIAKDYGIRMEDLKDNRSAFDKSWQAVIDHKAFAAISKEQVFEGGLAEKLSRELQPTFVGTLARGFTGQDLTQTTWGGVMYGAIRKGLESNAYTRRMLQGTTTDFSKMSGKQIQENVTGQMEEMMKNAEDPQLVMINLMRMNNQILASIAGKKGFF